MTITRRAVLIGAGLLAVVAVVGVALVVTRGDGVATDEARPPAPPPSVPTVAVQVDGADQSIAGQGLVELPADVSLAVAQAVSLFLADMSAGPMVGAEVTDATRAARFTPAARASALGEHRAAMVDDGVPTAHAITAGPARLWLRGLARADGSLALVSATFDWQATGSGTSDPLVVHRQGQLGMAPIDGAWLVDDYDVTVTRSGAGIGATTTTATSSATS